MRYSRVDNLPGHGVNETPFDIMGLDADGNEIESLASQMKFDQGHPSSVVSTLTGKKFSEKYPHHADYGCKCCCEDEASEFKRYENMLELTDFEINKL